MKRFDLKSCSENLRRGRSGQLRRQLFRSHDHHSLDVVSELHPRREVDVAGVAAEASGNRDDLAHRRPGLRLARTFRNFFVRADVMFVLLHVAEDHRTPVALVAELSGRV